jgi:hypothetical protein
MIANQLAFQLLETVVFLLPKEMQSATVVDVCIKEK